MKHFFSILLIAGCMQQADAQSWQWLNAPDVSSGGNSVFKKMDIDANGNVYSVGSLYQQATFGSTTLASNSNVQSLYLSKQDAYGNYSFARNIWADSGIATAVVKVDDNADIYVFGTCIGSTLHLSPTDSLTFTQAQGSSPSRLFLAKYSNSGTLIWAKKGEAQGLYANARAITSIGSDIYIGGDFLGTCTFLGQNMNGSTSNKGFVMKVDANGNGLWLKASENTAMCFVTRLTNDGTNVYATGKFQNTIKFDNVNVVNPLANPGGERIFLFKFNNSGATQWGKEEGGAYNYVTTAEDANNANHMVYDGNGHLYIGGSYQDATGTISNQVQNPFVSKYDVSTGSKLWTVQFTGAVGNAINGLAIDSSNNLICTGEYIGSFNAGSLSLPTDINAKKGMILKLSQTDGSCTAASMVGTMGNLTNVNEIIMSADKSYYVIGGIYKNTLDLNSTLSVSSQGMNTPFTARYNLGTGLSVHDRKQQLRYSLYPNPATNQLFIDREGQEKATLSVIDLSGKVLLTQDMPYGANQINISQLPAGSYFLKVATATQSGTQTFVKQ